MCVYMSRSTADLPVNAYSPFVELLIKHIHISLSQGCHTLRRRPKPLPKQKAEQKSAQNRGDALLCTAGRAKTLKADDDNHVDSERLWLYRRLYMRYSSVGIIIWLRLLADFKKRKNDSDGLSPFSSISI